MRITLLCLCLPAVALASAPLSVQVEQAVQAGSFQVGIGSNVSLLYPGDSAPHAGEFLGRIVQGDGELQSFMFFDEQDNSVEYVPAAEVEFSSGTSPDALQSVFKLFDQQDTGVCTAYAIYDLMSQLNCSGFTGNGELSQTLSTEEGRTHLLVDAVNQYYLEPQHQFSTLGILNGYGKRFGFSCKKKSFTDAESISAFLQKQLATGLPVAVGFWIGPDMFHSPSKLVDYDHPAQKQDDRLWIPRKIGERNSGGHTVVAVGSFVARGRLELVMLDSDWDSPRVWDFESIFGPKTDFKSIEFDYCN